MNESCLGAQIAEDNVSSRRITEFGPIWVQFRLYHQRRYQEQVINLSETGCLHCKPHLLRMAHRG